MTTQTERTYISDSESYAVFVGNITPQEFVKCFEEFECPIDEAIKDFIRNWPYPDEAPPSWLEDSLYSYIESALENE